MGHVVQLSSARWFHTYSESRKYFLTVWLRDWNFENTECWETCSELTENFHTVLLIFVFWCYNTGPVVFMLVMQVLMVALPTKLFPHFSSAPWKTPDKVFFLDAYVEIRTHFLFPLKGIWGTAPRRIASRSGSTCSPVQDSTSRQGQVSSELQLLSGAWRSLGHVESTQVTLSALEGCSLSPTGKRQQRFYFFNHFCIPCWSAMKYCFDFWVCLTFHELQLHSSKGKTRCSSHWCETWQMSLCIWLQLAICRHRIRQWEHTAADTLKWC